MIFCPKVEFFFCLLINSFFHALNISTFLLQGNALTKTGTTLKKMGNAEKDLIQKTMSQFIHPLKTFLDNDMRTVSVSANDIKHFIRAKEEQFVANSNLWKTPM